MHYFHVYNRGAHKEKTFLESADYNRFVDLLYLANSDKPVRYSRAKQAGLYLFDRGETQVNIIAYCLMPNHFHIFLREKYPGSKAIFMKKLCTAYSMYFNKKYDHSGIVFQGVYKEKAVLDDRYFHYLIQYIHLNPFDVDSARQLKNFSSDYFEMVVNFSKTYEYSSFKDYLGEMRMQRLVLSI